ncbi:hypothetical protein LCGC14_1637180 [marine sediment metagenome]|uniref:Uncharacterized protein n=1 Tax=marine sediment metagenome TaxID=412755 RepID=A0A0F9IN81_9ZZZZ
MKISKRSLHYRFLNRVSDYTPPRDLCRYMRNLVGWLFIWIVAIPSAIIGMIELVWLAVIGAQAFDALLDAYNVGNMGRAYLGCTMFIGFLAWIALVFGSFCWIADKISQRSQKREYVSGNDYEKKPSLLSEWWKAHKENVCLIIEFTE